VTAPAEGNFAFTKDTNSLWYYDGAAWVASGATGDIEGVTAGVGISGGGTSGTVTVTNSMATAITTAGDTLYGTGSGTFSRLGIGTAGQVLKVNSGATAPEWGAAAGGALELISTFTTSGVNSIDFTSISTAYKQLTVVWMGLYASTNNTSIGIRFNGDSASNYKQREIMFSNTTMTNNFDQTTSISCQTRGRFAGYNTDVAIGYLTIHNSNSTTLYKYVETATSNKNSVTSGYEIKKGSYAYTSNTAITEINFVRTETAGTIQIDTGGYVQVWGIK
jgi:hypothetical protein